MVLHTSKRSRIEQTKDFDNGAICCIGGGGSALFSFGLRSLQSRPCWSADLFPTTFREWLGYIVIPLAVLSFLYSWFRWHRKQVGDSNELEWLDELVQEHEKGIRDNSNTLKRLILTIEREHKNTPDLTKRLERARRVLNR